MSAARGEIKQAWLATEDGLFFEGRSCGADGQATGELCFNTSMTGYQEILTDPSYAGEIVTLTAVQIGNYGVNEDDAQSRGVFAQGLVVREMCETPSSWRSESSLPDYLRERGVVAIEGIDTRAIVRHLRSAGAKRAVISTTCGNREELVAAAKADPGLEGRDLASEVACKEPYKWNEGVAETEAGDSYIGDVPNDYKWNEGVAETEGGCSRAVSQPRKDTQLGNSVNAARMCEHDTPPLSQRATEACRYKVIAFDTGVKYDILRQLTAAGCEVQVVPPATTAAEVLAQKPDGVFLANGPGDPAGVDALPQTVSELLGNVPLFGICLGHQMLALAVGATTYKLKFGHRGGNHPVKNLRTGKVEITAQNHGFAVDFTSLGAVSGDLDAALERGDADESLIPTAQTAQYGRVQLTHVNLNDGTVEGIALSDVGAFSVQYHPEAAPGPHDAHYLFEEFLTLMGEVTR